MFIETGYGTNILKTHCSNVIYSYKMYKNITTGF